MKYHRVNIDGRGIFYREAGNADAPALLLLHGFPTSSHMFRDLMPRLADRYHVVAPDLPGFGFSDAPARAEFKYTFDNLARVMQAFAEKIGLLRYALYVFDYGAPVGFRLALAHAERDTALPARPRNDDIQLDLFLDYSNNVALYAKFQAYFRAQRPPLLAVWGKNDPFFLPAGAEAFKRDQPEADVHFYDTGHFALETHAAEIAAEIRKFLAQGQPAA